MNILQVGTGAIKIPPEKYGGTEFYPYRISKDIVRAGYDVTILDVKESKADPNVEYIDGIKFVRLHIKRAGIPSHSFIVGYIKRRIDTALFALKVSGYIKKGDFDIIHIYGTLIGLILTFLNGGLRGKMVYYCNSPAWFMSSLGRLDKLALTLECCLMRRVDKVIVETDSLEAKLVAMGKLKPERIAVIPPGVETSEFSPEIDAGDIRQRYGLEGRMTILFAGRIAPYKGVEYLVKAADIVVNDFGYRDVLFLLVGPLAEHETDRAQYADYIAKIFSFIKDSDLETNVKLTGVVPSGDLKRLFSACDIFVLPSLAETFGEVVSQAMASAKPVVGTRIAGIMDQIKDGWNGYLVEPANEHQLAEKIKYLIDHPEQRGRMGLNGRKFAEDEFDWSRVSDRVLQVYQSLA